MILYIGIKPVARNASNKSTFTLISEDQLPEYKRVAIGHIRFYERTNGIISVWDIIPRIENPSTCQLLQKTGNVYEAIKLSTSPDEVEKIIDAGCDAYSEMLDLEYSSSYN